MKDDNFVEEFDPIVDLLTPKASPRMPENIKSNVLSRIERRRALRRALKNVLTMKNTFSRIVASTAAVAAAVIVAVVSVRPTPAHAAEVGDLLDRSLTATEDVRTMTMKIDVRTTPHENFDYTNPLDEMVEHTLTVVRGDASRPLRWRLGKEGRHIVFDGDAKYLWSDGRRGAKGSADTGFEEWFNLLLDPSMVVMREKAALSEGVKYFVEETADEIVLRADVKARGDFSESDYLMFSSIGESPTRRRIVFDRATGLLKSMKIYVKAFGGKRLIVDVKSIEYNVPVDEAALVALPAGMEWRDATVPPPAGRFSGITAAEAAGLIADAIDAGDLGAVRETFTQYDFEFIRNHFRGARVLKRGETFRSGRYAGVFVPLKVQFADGRTKKVTLALRNDNQNRVWLVDGGI